MPVLPEASPCGRICFPLTRSTCPFDPLQFRSLKARFCARVANPHWRKGTAKVVDCACPQKGKVCNLPGRVALRLNYCKRSQGLLLPPVKRLQLRLYGRPWCCGPVCGQWNAVIICCNLFDVWAYFGSKIWVSGIQTIYKLSARVALDSKLTVIGISYRYFLLLYPNHLDHKA